MRHRKHAGFTLVEMLVSVALVLLLMTLFAQVFQIAGGSISTQRGLMENDQRARTAQTLIAGDFNKRTFRKVIPFALNEDLTAPEADLYKRRGYFYFSENVPGNDTDDVLAFTVDANLIVDAPDTLPYYGRAMALFPNPIPTGATPPQVPTGVGAQYRDDYFFRSNANQPETDDSRLDFNQSASSPYAEVAYFLRNGNLYRRVLLIRQPGDGNLANEQPDDSAGTRYLSRVYAVTGGFTYTYPGGFSTGFDTTGASTGAPVNFWRHFDYSGHPGLDASSGAYLYDGIVFNGVSSLTMGSTVSTFQYSAFSTVPPALPASQMVPPIQLAYPPNRFGHNTVNPVPLTGLSINGPLRFPLGGLPREYGTGGWWVGRPTMEETSHASLDYPMLTHAVPAGPGDNLVEFDGVPWADANSDGVIDTRTGGPWRGEDLLLANVHAFDIKVWDERTSQFVNLGDVGEDTNGNLTLDTMPNEDTNGNGVLDYPDFHPHAFYRRNNTYGPLGSSSLVFDTWYPFRTENINGSGGLNPTEDGDGNGLLGGSEDADGDGVLDLAEDGSAGDGELRGQLLDFDGDGAVTLSDTNSDGVVDFGEDVPPYRPLHAYPITGTAGSNAEIYTPVVRYPRWVGNTTAGGATWFTVGDRIFPQVTPQSTQHGDPFYYVCVGFDTSNTDGDSTISHSLNSSPPTWGRIAGGITLDKEVKWQAVDNRKPLRAIQITLRFVDPTTQQMRTLTLQQSLVD